MTNYRKQIEPGDPIGGIVDGVEVEGFKETYTTLIYDKPDFILAPDGLEAYGVTEGQRLNVLVVASGNGCPRKNCPNETRLWILEGNPKAPDGFLIHECKTHGFMYSLNTKKEDSNK